ncbi:probable E3 ubiquitin-protein ligase RNF217 [Megalops cyprinoides]|uniref:probable E3 ubiquitin-protein ligase RNF217 n=1 Tax=Megalops cyprinoides TaxID=118141 RepID=UPI00186500CE|nr:probable E3 ubiquitin-protein ligase RNF217 [Megalops cyprinoides]
MEDEPNCVNVTEEKMPSLASSYDGDTVSNVSEVSDEVGTQSTDFAHDNREMKVITPDGVLEFHKHRLERMGSKETIERDSVIKTTAVDILRRNFGTPRSLASVDSNTTEERKDTRDVSVSNVTSQDKEKCIASETKHCIHSGNEQVNPEHTPGLTAPDLDKVELSDLEENRETKSRGSDDTCQSKEHVYCTVYCIANDNYRRHADNLGGQADLDGGVMTSDVAVQPVEDSRQQAGLELAQYQEPFTISNLIDPRTLSNFYGGDYNVPAVLTCRICLEDKHIKPLHCCKKAVCEECLKRYISSQVRVGKVDIVCPITECSGYLEENVILAHLASEEVAKYKYFLELGRVDSSTKPCPQCSLFTSLKGRGQQAPSRAEHKYKIQCTKCQFVWCFKCHAPWHEGLKCRDYRKGDKLLRHWASVIEHGQRNAQKCPRCKIHIQRTEGCDHMTCTQCNTNFCYRCGEKYRHLRFFGDHTSNLSVFGCKYRYLPEKPHLRRLVRGSVCASKVLVAPLVIVLVVVFGAVALVIGLVAFPVYYICKQRRKRSQGTGRWL